MQLSWWSLESSIKEMFRKNSTAIHKNGHDVYTRDNPVCNQHLDLFGLRKHPPTSIRSIPNRESSTVALGRLVFLPIGSGSHPMSRPNPYESDYLMGYAESRLTPTVIARKHRARLSSTASWGVTKARGAVGLMMDGVRLMREEVGEPDSHTNHKYLPIHDLYSTIRNYDNLSWSPRTGGLPSRALISSDSSKHSCNEQLKIRVWLC